MEYPALEEIPSTKEKLIFGSYRQRKINSSQVELKDLDNPWNFMQVLLLSDAELLKWLRKNNLIANKLVACKKCNKSARLKSRSSETLGCAFICDNKPRHFNSSKVHSFFEGSKLDVRDILLFVGNYISGISLIDCARKCALNYSSTAVDRGSMVREVMVEMVFRKMPSMTLEGEIEIDESLFGRRTKYHRGTQRGCRIWIFGMIERYTRRLVLYPVESRDKETLIPLIQKHCAAGSTIFSDSWSSYLCLNQHGYNHFMVNHTENYVQIYENVDTGETKHVHTNPIEGQWKHCKETFRRMNGVRGMENFESHLCEVIYRHMHGTNNTKLITSYLSDIREIYTNDKPAVMTYSRPVFSTMAAENYDKSRIINEEDVPDEVNGSILYAEPAYVPSSYVDSVVDDNIDVDYITAPAETSQTDVACDVNVRRFSCVRDESPVVQEDHYDEKRKGPKTKTTKRKRKNPEEVDNTTDWLHPITISSGDEEIKPKGKGKGKGKSSKTVTTKKSSKKALNEKTEKKDTDTETGNFQFEIDRDVIILTPPNMRQRKIDEFYVEDEADKFRHVTQRKKCKTSSCGITSPSSTFAPTYTSTPACKPKRSSTQQSCSRTTGIMKENVTQDKEVTKKKKKTCKNRLACPDDWIPIPVISKKLKMQKKENMYEKEGYEWLKEDDDEDFM